MPPKRKCCFISNGNVQRQRIKYNESNSDSESESKKDSDSETDFDPELESESEPEEEYQIDKEQDFNSKSDQEDEDNAIAEQEIEHYFDVIMEYIENKIKCKKIQEYYDLRMQKISLNKENTELPDFENINKKYNVKCNICGNSKRNSECIINIEGNIYHIGTICEERIDFINEYIEKTNNYNNNSEENDIDFHNLINEFDSRKKDIDDIVSKKGKEAARFA